MSRTLVFGRHGADGVDIACDDPYVSARHLKITQLADGTFVAEDLGTSNGTWLTYPNVFGVSEWVLLRRPLPLLPGMRIRIGRTTLPWVVDR